jgi:catechol 2,3-dioxygenase-like lactoylglutathione lyase family enzyme
MNLDTRLDFKSANTILYCQKWAETVAFYQHRLGLPVTYTSDWFVEFRIAEGAYLSVADEARATIKSSGGAGLTVTLQVNDAQQAWQQLHNRGLAPDPVRQHAWGAHVFYFYDPEGHRLEIWSPL